MSSPALEVWSVAVCLYDHNTTTDFQGPVELFGWLAKDRINGPMGDYLHNPKIAMDIHYLSVSLDPVVPDTGPRLVPTDLYSGDKQYDVLLVPGGTGGTAETAPKELLEFLKKQAPRARYVLTVCTGSWVLAGTGLLDGKHATSNKFLFKQIRESTSKAITWVAKARWVVDGNFWTSSGVTAGSDMGNAFLIHIVGEETARAIRGCVELSAKGEHDDEFAAFFGLE